MGSEKPKLASDPPKRLGWDEFFIGVMFGDDGRKLYGAVSPAPYGVPMLFALAFVVGMLIGTWLPR